MMLEAFEHGGKAVGLVTVCGFVVAAALAFIQVRAAALKNIGYGCMKGLTNMALILYPDGTSEEVHPANGDHFEYEELMQIVEGKIQMIPLSTKHEVLWTE